MINLKSCKVEIQLKGSGKYAVDLVRAPLFDYPFSKINNMQNSSESEDEQDIEGFNMQPTNYKFCGIEANCITLVDFEKKEVKVL